MPQVAKLWILVVLALHVIYRDWIDQVFSPEDGVKPKPSRNEPASAAELPLDKIRYEVNKNETFCVDWDTNMDEWWTHNPEWAASLENETHYCFSYIQDETKAAFLRQLYEVQYNGDCLNAKTVELESNGWGASFLQVDSALLYAYENQHPIQVSARKGRWHYAAKKDSSKPVCPHKDMSCYFLNISSCRADPNNIEKVSPEGDFTLNARKGRWVYEYATRPQTWLRREIYKLTSSTNLATPCTVMHVRRSDAVLESETSRRYHAIQEYIDAAGNDITSNIFLLTDDQNAIEEATSNFSQYNWMYMDRPRYRGAEGGYESHIPSDNPMFEVVVILATFQLVEQCQTFVYSRSRFATQIKSKMPTAKWIDLDERNEVDNDANSTNSSVSKPVEEVPKRLSIESILEVPKNETFCVDWDTDTDEWWMHHPDWHVSLENDTHYCFSPMPDEDKAEFFRQLYDVQFNSDCSNVITAAMQSAGWGADFLKVNKGLFYAYENRQPVQMYASKGRWHYAAMKDASKPVCPRKDMSCYFLNITSCQADPDNVEEVEPRLKANIHSRRGRWAYEYATRPQTWLRRDVYKLSSSTNLVSPCTVMHVRRTDVVLHGRHSRKYHAIQEYVDATGENLTKNIFLLTDDQNAIEEATSQFPEYNWMYIDRPRFRGAEGGWEQQIPSEDPKFEVTVILSTFQLVQQCEAFVYGRSRFASQIRKKMPHAKAIYIDEGNDLVSAEENALSVNISHPFLQRENSHPK